jgi:two-component system, chemotaxis family, protein-glutamate methylesterase/glutaminase
MSRPRRIVICDASAEQTRRLTQFLEEDPGLTVAAAFASTNAAVAQVAEAAPDLVALALDTVGTDVRSAVESLLKAGRTPVLLLADADTQRAAAGLAAGAIDVIPADRLFLDDPAGVWATALRSRIKRLANVRLRTSTAGAPNADGDAGRAWRGATATYRAVALGASVGGPPALASVLTELPADFPLPVLVVQHMAEGFGDSLAAWLDRIVPPPVRLPVDGEPLRPGVWMAPEGAHLSLDSTMRLRLDRETERGAHRPSLDVLFESLAATLGSEAVGVVLTGMGRDGADGVSAISRAGGLTIAQDEETSAVFGMPAAAAESGVDFVLPLEELASKLATLRASGVR